jgi:RNA polymerase sigma factor (sigma-70 family)
MHVEEQKLIENLKKGNQVAFRELVKIHQTKVFNNCLGFVRNQTEAEDLTQEVFIEVFHSIQKFKGDSKLSTWIYRISVTKSLDFLKSQKRQKRFAFLKSIMGFEDDQPQYEPVEHNHPGVLFENKERASILFSKIDELSDNQRIAFTLSKIDGLSYQEIAEVMQLSMQSIEALLFRAKQNLQKKLKNYYEQL